MTEALLYRSGAISRMCKVEDGATTTDYEPEEIKRGVSVNATLAPVEWRDSKINFIDTPGFSDFVAEVKGAFRAVDSALIVVCAISGVQVGTEQCWKMAEEAKLPRIVFVNKMDRDNADYDSILHNLRTKFGKRVLPLELPLGKAEDFCGVIDVFKMKAYKASGNGSDEIDIPSDMLEWAKDAHGICLINKTNRIKKVLCQRVYLGLLLKQESLLVGVNIPAVMSASLVLISLELQRPVT